MKITQPVRPTNFGLELVKDAGSALRGGLSAWSELVVDRLHREFDIELRQEIAQPVGIVGFVGDQALDRSGGG